MTDEGWAFFPYMFKMDMIYMYGDIYLKKILKSVKNPFWNDEIKSLLLLIEKTCFHGIESLLATPIWYNSKMIPYKLTSWVEKGITTVGDILDENGDIQSKDYIQSTWNVTCNFLLYVSLKKNSTHYYSEKCNIPPYFSTIITHPI